MLFALLFWGVIIVLAVWLVTRKPKSGSVDYDSKTYAQGYWDGWRAHKQQSEQFDQPAMAALVEDMQGPVVLQEPVAPPTVAVTESPADTAAIKQKRDLQNINTALYVASFLLVASAALFIGASLPGEVKFIGTWIITLVFYVTGLVLYRAAPKLRPAAIAFTGTGLALLPFTGLAMYNYVLPDSAMSWLITSVVGVVAYVIATLRLQSQLVAYFAVAFMISLSVSSVAVLQSALLWYFVVLIGFGSLVTIVATLRPKWLPAVFTKPIQTGSTIIVPLTLGASLFAGLDLSLVDYEIILAMGTLYYTAVAFSAVSSLAYVTAHITARSLVTLFTLFVAYDVSDEWWVVGMTLTIVSALQVLVSAFATKYAKSDAAHSAWVWIGLSLLAVAPLFAAGAYGWATIVSYQLTALLVASVIASSLARRAGFLFFGLFAVLVLPPIVMTQVVQPPLAYHYLALFYVVCAAIGLYARATFKATQSSTVNMVANVALGIFLTESLIFTVATESQAWTAVLLLLAAVIGYGIVYVEKIPQFVIVANLLAVLALGGVVDLTGVSQDWRAIAIGWLAFAVFYAGYWLLMSLNKSQYASFMFWFTIIVPIVMSISGVFSADTSFVLASIGVLGLVSLLLTSEGFATKRYVYIDVAAIIGTIALQRLVAVMFSGVDVLVYSQWWAIVFAGLAYLYYARGDKTHAKTRLIIGLSIFSFFSAITALSESFAPGALPYKLIFLVEHVALLVVGLVTSKRLLSIWGTVGVVLAVFWMLAGYTYALLSLVAVLLIGFAIYALLRKNNAA